MKSKIKVGVIFGGRSVENEISVITANQAMAAMDTEKYEITPKNQTEQSINNQITENYD